MKIQAILFDLDGTLLDSAPDFLWIINQMLTRRAKLCINLAVITEQASNGVLAMLASAFKLTPEHPDLASLKQEFLQLYSSHLNKKSHLYKGVDELLDYIEARGLLWAVVTNKPALYTHPILDHFKLSQRAGAIICPEHVNKTKPDPEPLLLACTQMSVAAENCWYIGDHLRDIEAGNAANMITVGCQYGYLSPADDSQSWGADFLIKQPTQLISLLDANTLSNTTNHLPKIGFEHV